MQLQCISHLQTMKLYKTFTFMFVLAETEGIITVQMGVVIKKNKQCTEK